MARSIEPRIRRRDHTASRSAVHTVWEADVGSAEYYRRREEEFDDTSHTQKIYKAGTESLSDWIKELWYQYCEHVDKDPMGTLKAMPIKVLDNFFHYVLHVRRASVRHASTLQTYWNVFTLMRRKETGIVDINPLVKTQMHGVRQRLAADFELSTERKPKAIVRAEDEFELLKVLWGSSRVPMEHERLRVQLALLIQLAGITGSRPSALMGITYGDFALSLLKDPKGGEWPRLVVDVTLTQTKSYLGPKAHNTIPIPQVASEPCLLLCPQIMLLSLMFADQAFDGLTEPDQLFRLKVTPGLHEQRLPIKEEWQRISIFRRLKHEARGVVVSPDVAATATWLRDKLNALGKATGFYLPVGPYCFRRGAGEAFDSSSHISDSQRNLIPQHASSAVFQNSYLSRYITADTQAAFRGLEPQTAVMRAASGMSRTIDPRRPTALTAEQQAQVARHPEVKLLRRYRKGLKSKIRKRYGTITRARGSAIYTVYRHAVRDCQNTSKAVRKAMVAESRRLYQRHQPTLDIERQLNDDVEKRPQKAGPEDEQPLSSHRSRALNALLAFVPSDPEEESKRRSEAIAAVAALSQRREPVMPKVCRPRSVNTTLSPSDDDDKVEIDLSFPLVCHPTQCIFCLGDTALSSERRAKEFHSRGTLRRHFQNRHLQHLPDDEPVDCPHPRCKITLNSKMHLQNHAEAMHKTVT